MNIKASAWLLFFDLISISWMNEVDPMSNILVQQDTNKISQTLIYMYAMSITLSDSLNTNQTQIEIRKTKTAVFCHFGKLLQH